MSPLWGNGRKFTITNLQVSSSTPLHPYPGFSRDPRKHWAKNIFGRVQNRSRLSVRAVRAFGRDTKTDDAGAAAQPKRRGRGAVRRANGLSADSTLDFRCRFARHRASPASFRPSGRPRAVGHETLRVTKGHENARPSVVSDNRRCQAAQAASGNANSSLHGAAVRLELRLDEPDLCGVDFIAEQTKGRLFVPTFCLT